MVEYQAGGLEAFEGLYETLAGDLARHFEAVLRDRDRARDLVQDTFMEIHRSRHTYRPPLPVRPWVFGIARNVLRRHRRLAGRRARREELPGNLEGRQAPGRAPGVGRIEADDVAEAMGRLAPARRRAFVLHHVHGFSFREIARLLHISVDGAKLRSSRAMSRVRHLLGVEGGSKRG
jgi:RNA polymerase sigma-70 factor (ECF subfamily)